MQAAMALMRLHRCAVSLESLLLDNMISKYILVLAQIIITVNVLEISTFFSFCSQLKYCFFGTGIHKMLVRIANREDPDQTASEEAV